MECQLNCMHLKRQQLIEELILNIHTISRAKGNTYYINKGNDDKIFLLLNLEGRKYTGIANIYVAERNEHNIKMLDFKIEFDNLYNLQKILIIEIIDPFPIFLGLNI